MLTVLISSFNHEKYLHATIESALRIGSKTEILLTDDGSTDSSPEILKHFSDKYQSVSYFPGPRENIGFGNRIALFEGHISSKYVVALNSDDLLLKCGVDLALKKLEVFEADFATGAIGLINEAGESNGYLNGPFMPQIKFPDFAKEYLSEFKNGELSINSFYLLAMQNWVRTSSNLIVKNETFWSLGGMPRYFYASDWALSLSLLAKYKGVYSKIPFVNYRTHSANTISDSINQSSLEVSKIFRLFLEENSIFQDDKNFVKLRSMNPYLN